MATEYKPRDQRAFNLLCYAKRWYKQNARPNLSWRQIHKYLGRNGSPQLIKRVLKEQGRYANYIKQKKKKRKRKQKTDTSYKKQFDLF